MLFCVPWRVSTHSEARDCCHAHTPTQNLSHSLTLLTHSLAHKTESTEVNLLSETTLEESYMGLFRLEVANFMISFTIAFSWQPRNVSHNIKR